MRQQLSEREAARYDTATHTPADDATPDPPTSSTREQEEEEAQRLYLRIDRRRLQIARAKLHFTLGDFAKNPSAELLADCEAAWGRAPREVRMLENPDNEVQWHLAHLRDLYKDVLGPLPVRGAIVERLRTETRKRRHSPT
jgi:hypothetical protein